MIYWKIMGNEKNLYLPSHQQARERFSEKMLEEAAKLERTALNLNGNEVIESYHQRAAQLRQLALAH